MERGAEGRRAARPSQVKLRTQAGKRREERATAATRATHTRVLRVVRVGCGRRDDRREVGAVSAGRLADAKPTPRCTTVPTHRRTARRSRRRRRGRGERECAAAPASRPRTSDLTRLVLCLWSLPAAQPSPVLAMTSASSARRSFYPLPPSAYPQPLVDPDAAYETTYGQSATRPELTRHPPALLASTPQETRPHEPRWTHSVPGKALQAWD